MNQKTKCFFLCLFLMLSSTFLLTCSNSNNEDDYPDFIQYEQTPRSLPLHHRFKESCIKDDIDTAESIMKVDKFFRDESKKNSLLPQIKTPSAPTQTKTLLGVKKMTSTVPSLLSKKDEFNCDILYIVASKGLTNIANMLLEHEADPQSKNGAKKRTPLCVGIQNGHQNVVQLILERLNDGEINNPCDIRGNRPLHIANQSYGMTNLLFIEDADIYTVNNAGKKPDGCALSANIRELYEGKKQYDQNRNNI